MRAPFVMTRHFSSLTIRSHGQQGGDNLLHRPLAKQDEGPSSNLFRKNMASFRNAEGIKERTCVSPRNGKRSRCLHIAGNRSSNRLASVFLQRLHTRSPPRQKGVLTLLHQDCGFSRPSSRPPGRTPVMTEPSAAARPSMSLVSRKQRLCSSSLVNHLEVGARNVLL